MSPDQKSTRLLRRPELLKKVGFSHSELYRRLNGDSAFPKPIKLGVRAVAWRESEVDDWIKSLSRVVQK